MRLGVGFAKKTCAKTGASVRVIINSNRAAMAPAELSRVVHLRLSVMGGCGMGGAWAQSVGAVVLSR